MCPWYQMIKVCVFMMFSPRPGLPAVSVVATCQRALVNESRRKGRDKKEAHETTSCTSVGFSVGSVGFPVGITISTASERHFRRLQLVAAHGPSHRYPSTCQQVAACKGYS